MAAIRIHDLTDDHVLAFDLAELLDALGKPAELSAWKCNVGECIAQDDAPADLEDAFNAPAGLSGAELVALAAETLQIVDGVFEAFRPSERQAWIKLEAIDSTFWEVFAASEDDLAPLRLRFAEVETIEEDGE
jgi:hypothetical protein